MTGLTWPLSVEIARPVVFSETFTAPAEVNSALLIAPMLDWKLDESNRFRARSGETSAIVSFHSLTVPSALAHASRSPAAVHAMLVTAETRLK